MLAALAGLAGLLAGPAAAHGVALGDQSFLRGLAGVHPGPFIYLGAKHMVTGYDHLLYLAGVIFFLRRLGDVAKYVSLFALGHSITLLFGVLSGLHVNAYLVDAVIGLSVCYKALENLGARGFPDPRLAVFGFGLVHGFGLSSKLQDLELAREGLVANMIFFNIGVEIGQVLALALLFTLLSGLRRRAALAGIAEGANLALFAAGLLLFGFQLSGYFLT